jgi:hypothetical protein
MKARVYYVLRDSEKSFVSDTSVGDWLNEAYLDLVARLRLLEKEATGTTGAGGTLALPADFLELTSFDVADVNGNYYRARFSDNDVFDSWRLDEDEPEAQLARIFNGTIETYPVAASVGYVLRYVYKPTALSAGGDIPAIPEELHVRLVNYARAHAKYQEGELDEGDRYMAMYTEGLPGAPLTSHRLRPGPFDLVPQPGYFD